jgi:hypothetical protein
MSTNENESSYHNRAVVFFVSKSSVLDTIVVAIIQTYLQWMSYVDVFKSYVMAIVGVDWRDKIICKTVSYNRKKR